MLGKITCLLLVLYLGLTAQPFSYSPNPHSSAGDAIAYKYIQTYVDGYGNHWLETYIYPRITSAYGQVLGEGIFHVYTFLDTNITSDPIYIVPLVFGEMDQHIFSPYSIQLTSNVITNSNILTPAGWTMYYPVAWINPYQQLDPDYLSCSFHFDPIAFVGLPQVLTSRTLIPPIYYGMWLYIQHHSAINFTSDYFGSGWGVVSNSWWISL